MDKVVIQTHSDQETRKVGCLLADKLPDGSVVILDGDLGAGKTTLVRGVAEGLHIKEVVQSPTFNIMKLYLKGDRPLIHIDAYRLADIDNDIGLDEYIGYETGLTMIEWPIYIPKLIPNNAVKVEIRNLGEEDREITISCSDKGLLEDISNG